MAKTDLSAVSAGVLKRVVLGRAFSSARLEHTLLPKVLALPVFASDAFRRACGGTFPGDRFESLGPLELPGRMDLIEAWSQRDAKIAAEPSTRAFEPLSARARD